MQKVINSFRWATNGIRTTWREEVNFRIEILCAFGVVVAGVYLNFSKLEWAFIAACITAVLAAEMVNTAVEDLCNKVESNTDTLIGKIKDVMGGFVLIVVAGASIIGLMVFSNHF
ncbi:MAG: hypothetical protein A2481_03350 [Candidatus Yonathbacteria bacterium RIFOXYC2_FULL_47_9]|nr:MAG: hypothetical protein A2481_03350 [Candidatus Yonathbacteria bacterium RIFOXYC2_FULL_47_9]HAT68462.1 diacylglycerol kinase [Candidatus Yonathbacteria bacterium]